jgi:hypothetical protein
LSVLAPLALAIAAAAPSPAAADAPPIAVAPMAVDGDLPDAWRPRLSAALQRGLRELDVAALPAGSVSCDDACRATQASAAGRDLVVVPELRADGNLFELEMRVVDAAGGGLVARRTEPCKPCGRADVEGLVERQAASLAEWIRATPRDHVLDVETAPAGARVFVDGEDLGTAPLRLHLSEGEHDVVVRAPGHRARRRTVATVRGVTERWTVTLEPTPAGPARDRLWPIGWATIVTGTLAVGGGATLLALHHRPYRLDCEGADYDPRNDVCRRRYATLPHGAVLTALGSAAIATGIVLVVAGHRRRQARRIDAAAALHPGGVTGWIGGRF